MEEKSKYIRPYEERIYKSIFLGKIENSVQKKNRKKYSWKDAIEIFEMPEKGEYKYNQEEYLDMIGKSKFGLCLPGYGNKCNREIELMALGTVPLITDGVDIVNYWNPPIENEHYICVSSPDDTKWTSISKEEWTIMSKNCVEWYQNNCSAKGSFEITKNIIERYS